MKYLTGIIVFTLFLTLGVFGVLKGYQAGENTQFEFNKNVKRVNSLFKLAVNSMNESESKTDYREYSKLAIESQIYELIKQNKGNIFNKFFDINSKQLQHHFRTWMSMDKITKLGLFKAQNNSIYSSLIMEYKKEVNNVISIHK